MKPPMLDSSQARDHRAQSSYAAVLETPSRHTVFQRILKHTDANMCRQNGLELQNWILHHDDVHMAKFGSVFLSGNDSVSQVSCVGFLNIVFFKKKTAISL